MKKPIFEIRSVYMILFSLLCISCEKHYMGVSKVFVNQSTLASTFVRSPDPNQVKPPTGEKLYINWLLPLSLKPQDLHITLSIIYKDLTEEKITYPVSHRIGSIVFPLINEKFKQKEGFHAYQALLLDKDETIIDKWEHQMWTHIIH